MADGAAQSTDCRDGETLSQLARLVLLRPIALSLDDVRLDPDLVNGGDQSGVKVNGTHVLALPNAADHFWPCRSPKAWR